MQVMDQRNVHAPLAHLPQHIVKASSIRNVSQRTRQLRRLDDPP
jgi:hypothetical protein